MNNNNTTNLDKVTEIFEQVRDLETTNEQKKHKIQEQSKKIIDTAKREAEENYNNSIESAKKEIEEYLHNIENKIEIYNNEQNIKINRELEEFCEHIDRKKIEALNDIKSKLF